jgi:hypothetical protein
MAIQLDRLSDISVRRIAPAEPRETSRHLARAGVETIVRSSLIGMGVGISLTPDQPGSVIGIAAIGVLAIGAALASWGT